MGAPASLRRGAALPCRANPVDAAAGGVDPDGERRYARSLPSMVGTARASRGLDPADQCAADPAEALWRDVPSLRRVAGEWPRTSRTPRERAFHPRWAAPAPIGARRTSRTRRLAAAGAETHGPRRNGGRHDARALAPLRAGRSLADAATGNARRFSTRDSGRFAEPPVGSAVPVLPWCAAAQRLARGCAAAGSLRRL